MAKITKMPSQAIINGFKGVIDFYVHDGIPCARTWPRTPGRHRAPAVEAQWPAFSWTASYWNYLSLEVKQAYNQMAVGTYKTGRDLFTMSFINGDYLYLQEV